MDIPSYLLGKSKGGGGEAPVLIDKTITSNNTYNASDDSADGYKKVVVNVPQPSGTINITQNGTVNVTNYASADVNVSADVSEYFTSSISSGSSSVPGFAKLVKKLPNNLTASGTIFNNAFKGYEGVEIPYFDTSTVTNFNGCFSSCPNLTTIPLLNTTSASNLLNIISSTPNLTDTSLDNVLQMCANTKKYNQTKTLQACGANSTNYPASRIQALPHYQDFIDAGWTIGY